MSILIRGMEMPTEGYRSYNIYADGRVETYYGDKRVSVAVNVPPHGRLIDADALPRFGGRKGLIHASDVDAAPTIIEAEVKS